MSEEQEPQVLAASSPGSEAEHGEATSAEDPTLDVKYKAPPMKTIEELAKMDNEDESLRKWKEKLGLFEATSCKSDDPRKFVPLALILSVEGRSDIVIDISTPEAIIAAKTDTKIIKEGTTFTLSLQAKVQNDSVYCVRYKQTVKRTMFKDSIDVMLGSFGPKPEPYQWIVATENAPSGKLFRGTYSISTRIFTEDHVKDPMLQFEWNMKVTQDWDSDKE